MKIEAVAGKPQWVAARRGCLTTSRMKDAAARLKKGEWSDKRFNLMRDLAAERMTGIAVSHYVTDAMQHGLDFQDAALAAYEEATGAVCGPEYFILHDTIEGYGGTPDALLENDPDGQVEIKCPETTTFIRWVMEGVVPEDHKLQMIAQLACTGRKWCDFVAFDPRMPEGRQLFVRRFEPTREEIAAVEKIAVDFIAELEAMVDAVNKAVFA